jgi:hypothetical protein
MPIWPIFLQTKYKSIKSNHNTHSSKVRRAALALAIKQPSPRLSKPYIQDSCNNQHLHAWTTSGKSEASRSVAVIYEKRWKKPKKTNPVNIQSLGLKLSFRRLPPYVEYRICLNNDELELKVQFLCHMHYGALTFVLYVRMLNSSVYSHNF